MSQTLETVADCEDFVAGCLFMGTGGGGDPQEGTQVLTAALNDGLDLGWHDADAIEDGTLTAMVYGIGSIAPPSAEKANLVRRMHLRTTDEPQDELFCRAIEALSAHLGQQIGCIVAAELGASNTPLPIVAAARLDIPIVDGDYSGRAVPEEMQSTPYAYGVSSDPLAAIDRWGNRIIVAQAANPYMLERLARHIAIACIDGAAIASTPLPASEMKRIVVPNTLSQCLSVGRACRRAIESGDDPVAAALAITGGWRLFEGVVVAKEWRDSDGFMIGTLEVEGTAESTGHRMRAWFKNEIHVTWLDDHPWVCSPDLVTLVDPASGRGFTNTDVADGDQVVAVGMRGLEVLRRPAALLNGSGPAYFGFGVSYVPIEQLLVGVPTIGGAGDERDRSF